jgi:hypothetical protein
LSDNVVLRALKILRWAISIVALTACLLSGALWVRSYWWGDDFIGTSSRKIGTSILRQRQWTVVSVEGRTIWDGFPFPRRGTAWRVESSSLAPRPPRMPPRDLVRNLRQIRIYHHYPIFPHWVPMIACALIGAVPWLRWRFNIRGVLVLMAFIAAMFAILVFE